MTAMLREETLVNGLKISFADESNRYFGDYHRVCVVATIHCELHELPLTGPEGEALRRKAYAVIGDRLSIVKRFERMGVSSAAVDEVREALIDNFLRASASYLSRPDYPYALLKTEMNKRGRQKYHV